MSEHATRRILRWTDLLLIIVGTAIWLYNAYRLVTGLRTMTLLDGLSAGMIFFIGPCLLWRWFSGA
jgi:hypothetical protein